MNQLAVLHFLNQFAPKRSVGWALARSQIRIWNYEQSADGVALNGAHTQIRLPDSYCLPMVPNRIGDNYKTVHSYL